MAFNKMALTFYGILILANLTNKVLADNTTYDPYALPSDKSALNLCRQSALAAIVGQMVAIKIRNTPAGFLYQFDIKAKDQSLNVVTCEGNSQKVIRIQRLE